jgi:allantoinase
MIPNATGPFPYKPITKRPKLVWPEGKRLALWVIPNIETYSLDQKIETNQIPDVNNWSKREYGNRVGVFRIIHALSRFGIRGTVALNSWICDRAPDIVEAVLEADWELMGHGETNDKRLTDTKSLEEERDLIGRTLDRIEKACGKRPRGWLGPGAQETWNSVELLADAGIKYVVDWTTDDQPYLVDAGKGRTLCSLPYGHDMGDMNAIKRGHYTPADFTQMMIDTFNVLYRESAVSGRVMPISLHPFLSGTPHRIESLHRGLEYITRYDDVWLATGGEIYDHYMSQGHR